MRILYLGVFERPYDTEVYIANSLKMLGHEVVRIPMVKTGLGLAQQIVREDCDFILFSKGWFEGDNEKVSTVFKQSGKITVGWFFDLAWGTRREHQVYEHMTFKADIVCTTDGGHDEEFKKAKINHHVLRQGIYEPEAYLEKGKHKHDIVFVGGYKAHSSFFNWPYRKEMLDWIEGNYPGFAWYGQEDGVRNKALNKLFSETKIVMGDSVYSPHYWSNRLYETIGRGGFLIFPEIPGLEKEFTPYKHFIPYKIGDYEGLKEKLDYYLSHDKEREDIRIAGFEHCKKYHTYTKRCERLIEIVNDYKRASGRVVFGQDS